MDMLGVVSTASVILGAIIADLADHVSAHTQEFEMRAGLLIIIDFALLGFVLPPILVMLEHVRGHP
jgi:hypothetical protein